MKVKLQILNCNNINNIDKEYTLECISMKNISAILNTGISIFNGHNILVINFENPTIIQLNAYSEMLVKCYY